MAALKPAPLDDAGWLAALWRRIRLVLGDQAVPRYLGGAQGAQGDGERPSRVAVSDDVPAEPETATERRQETTP